MQSINNITAVFGNAPAATDFALRKVLRLKNNSGFVVILDLTGRGAMILDGFKKNRLFTRPVTWFDVGNLRRPVALFQMGTSDHFRQVMRRLLKTMRTISRMRITDKTINWATEAALNLSRLGTIGLGALLKSFSSPEVRNRFLAQQSDPNDFRQLVDMIAWTLRFPAVYAISEGNNSANLQKSLKRSHTIWIEALSEHFERYEHLMIIGLIEAVIEDAVRIIIENISKTWNSPTAATVVHLFPSEAICSELPVWIRETSNRIRHVGVHKLNPDRPLNSLQTAWAKEAHNLCVLGNAKALKKSAHKSWLDDNEINRISSLDTNDIWVKFNATGKEIVAKGYHGKELLSKSYKVRHNAIKGRKIIPVRQMSSGVASIIDGTNGQYGLYRKLCEQEILRLGWFKVKTTSRESHGVDRVTIAMFKENLKEELAKLAYELDTGAYRCRPLRRFYITKSEGGKRPISIGCVRDRVAQSACLLLLGPIFDQTFSQRSFAFRPGRNAHQAIALTLSMIESGRTWAVIADIKNCFDSINHSLLLNHISQKIGDREMVKLVSHWLTVDVLELYDLLPIEAGVPQGESLSPLLANIYLDSLDKHFEKLGFDFVRYADDIIILTTGKKAAQKALRVMKDFLFDRLLLELKPAKTNVVSIVDGFEFLGFMIQKGKIEVRDKKLSAVLTVLREHIKILGHKSSTLKELSDSIILINAIIRGFRNYFLLSDEKYIKKQMEFLNESIDKMADYYLPEKIKNDPAWIGREKFCLNKTILDIESQEERSVRKAKAGNGYPDENQSALPAQWMIKDDFKNNNNTKKKSIVTAEDAVCNETNRKNMKNNFVEVDTRLYVLIHGAYLNVSNDELVIKNRKVEIYRRPLIELELLFLQGIGINISVDLQLKLAELDITTVFAPPIGGAIAVLNPIVSSTSFLRGLQILRRDDPDIVTSGLNMIASKTGNQAAVLRYFSKYRKIKTPDLGRQMSGAAEDIKAIAGNIRMLDPTAPSVRSVAMGLEGNAAAIYWRQVMNMFPEELEFIGRKTRYARDRVNQCLNYVYAMLYGEVWRAIVRSGLDPYFGLMHGAKRDQGSLVFDLIEEFRAPFADRLIIAMIGRGFQPGIGRHGYLKTKAKRQIAAGFLKKWAKKILWRSQKLSPASILDKQAKSLVQLFKSKGTYLPYKMRW